MAKLSRQIVALEAPYIEFRFFSKGDAVNWMPVFFSDTGHETQVEHCWSTCQHFSLTEKVKFHNCPRQKTVNIGQNIVNNICTLTLT